MLHIKKRSCFLQRRKWLNTVCNILALTPQAPDPASEDTGGCGKIRTSRGINQRCLMWDRSFKTLPFKSTAGRAEGFIQNLQPSHQNTSYKGSGGKKQRPITHPYLIPRTLFFPSRSMYSITGLQTEWLLMSHQMY